MFRFNHHYQGAYYLSFAQVIVNKIISENISLWLVRWCCCSHTTEPTTTMYFN